MWKKRLVEEEEENAAAGSSIPPKRRRVAAVKDDGDDEEDILVGDDDEDDAEGPAAEDEEEQIDGYDSADEYDDELYKNAADKAVLLAKTDLEREMILAERHDRKQRRVETLRVRQEVRAQRETMAATKQRSGAGSRARAAQSAQLDRAAKMAQLAQQRQAKQKTLERERSLREEQQYWELEDEVANDPMADEDAGSEEGEMADPRARRSEVSTRPAAAAEPAAPSEGPAPVGAIERIRLTRDKLEKWLNEPFFEDIVPGCFARVGIGKTSEGKSIYRVAEITHIKDGFKQYSIAQRSTTKRLELEIGTSRRYFQISYISNNNFEADELERYLRHLEAANKKGKTLTSIDKKVEVLKKCNTYEYKDGEVETKVKQERKSLKMKGNIALQKVEMRRNVSPHRLYIMSMPTHAHTPHAHFSAVQIQAMKDANTHLERQKLTGEAEADESVPFTLEDIFKAEDELRGLEGKQEVEKRIEQKRESSSFRINDINLRNREFEREIAAKVGLQELKEQVEISAGRTVASDPFKRLPVRPVIYWDIGAKKEGNEAAAPATDPAAVDPATADPAAAGPIHPAALAISTDAQGISSSDMLSPGFSSLKPPTADGSGGGSDEPTVRGSSTVAAEDLALPKLTGKKVQAHDIDIDIDIERPVSRTAPPPRARPEALMRAAHPLTASEGGAAPSGGQRLSLSEYKKLMKG